MAIAAAAFLPPLLMAKLAKMDRALLVYSVATYGGFLVFGAIVSFPRFAAVLFPLWLPLAAKLTLSKRQVALVAGVLVVFFLFAVDMWVSFLGGQFVA